MALPVRVPPGDRRARTRVVRDSVITTDPNVRPFDDRRASPTPSSCSGLLIRIAQCAGLFRHSFTRASAAANPRVVV